MEKHLIQIVENKATIKTIEKFPIEPWEEVVYITNNLKVAENYKKWYNNKTKQDENKQNKI